MISQTHRGFTLMELMIVIAIIGILAAALFPSMNGYLARARDTGKKNELNQLQLAIESYHIDQETYLVQGAGWMGQGQGWINYSDGNPFAYPSSLLIELQRMGYGANITKQKTAVDIYTPIITTNKLPCVTGSTRGSSDLYMLYFNDSLDTYSLSAYLESPTDKNIADILISYNGSGANGTCTKYGRNYAVGR